MDIMSKIASRVSIDEVKKQRNKIKLYETDTEASRTYQTKNLTTSGDLLKVPVQRWTKRVAIIVPGNEGEAAVQIASVGVPLSMAIKRSVFNTDENIYVTDRATNID